MKAKMFLGLFLTAAVCLSSAGADAKPSKPVDVAVYYFGNYHVDPRNEAHHGKGWTEWEYVKGAKPRFEGHRQPKVPLWGYLDEANPKDMAKKIDAAADHGVDAFLFDWYWYNGPFLNRTIDEGLKGAPNRNRIKYALMWANHEWLSLKPALPRKPRPLLYPGGVTPAEFDQVCDHVIERYFKDPNYWKIDGCPYFSIYDLTMLGSKLGGFEGTKAAFERFRAKVKAAGFPGLHLAIVYWGRMRLAGGPKNSADLVKALGFDSATSYVWVHHTHLRKRETDYNSARDQYFTAWDNISKSLALPYYPNLSMGWDSSPRTDQTCTWTPSGGYPFGNVIVNNTPENFRKAAELIKARLDANPKLPRIVTVNSWNEWTEGSYIEPDKETGFAYLEAIRDVFGPTGK
ncbi:MAG: glycoside hydrolase family 99-like domain-containing protein [Kiritimatiellae bacterium]|nr:glycoside hydrolase family 99-like domain-containing protein [Kiritimatiellia bacterium]